MGSRGDLFRLLLLSCLVQLPLLSRAADPRIELASTAWDFGTITNQNEISHDFWLTNSGDGPLIILSVVSSCDTCLHADIEHRNIPPGAATVIHSRLDLRLLNGPVSRRITIHSNDPSNSVAVVDISGYVVPLFSIQPLELILDLSQSQQSAAVITPLIPMRAPLSRVECSDTNLNATVSSLDGNQFVLTVSASPALPQGQKHQDLFIFSADSRDPSCAVKVFVRKPQEHEVLPARLDLAARAEPQQRVLWIKQHSAAPWTLLDAIPPSNKFQCEIDPDPTSYDYRIYLTAAGLESSVDQTNLLVLKFQDQNGHPQSLDVPIAIRPDGE